MYRPEIADTVENHQVHPLQKQGGSETLDIDALIQVLPKFIEFQAELYQHLHTVVLHFESQEAELRVLQEALEQQKQEFEELHRYLLDLVKGFYHLVQ